MDALTDNEIFAICLTSPSMRVYPLASPILLTVTSKGTTCGYSNGSFVIAASGGTPPYTFTRSGYPPANTGNFQKMVAGNYTVLVTDATGQTATANIILTNDLTPPAVKVTGIQLPSGCTTSDAQMVLLGNGGTAPYKYSLDGINFVSTNTFTNLSAGYYTAFVQDANGCIGSKESLTETLIGTPGYQCLSTGSGNVNYLCEDGGGEIITSAGSGSPPYQYSIDGIHFQDNGRFPNLLPGLYPITIKDSQGKMLVFTWSIFYACELHIHSTATPATCGQSDGTLTLTTTNGTAPYQYSIDGINFQASSIFTGLRAGNYTFIVKDDAGAINSATLYMTDKCPVVTATTVNENCGLGNGIITVTASNGTPPYLYSIDGVNFQSSNIFTGLTAGSFTVTLKDGLGLTGTSNIIVKASCLIVSASSTDVLCESHNGTITAGASGGKLPYQYSKDGVLFQTNPLFAGLDAGTYTLYVKDADGATASINGSVNNGPEPLMIVNAEPASCFDRDGTMAMTVSGGTSPYQYSIDQSAFQQNNVFTGLASGNYTASVKDAGGCLVSQSIKVSLVNNLSLDAGRDVSICEGAATPLIAASNAINLNWYPSSDLSNALIKDPVASPKTTTKYYITGTTGPCQITDSVSVFVLPAPIADAGGGLTICSGLDAQLHGSGGISCRWEPSTYLDNPAVFNPVVARPAGTMTYQLEVTGANGCKSINTTKVTVTITPPGSLFAGNDTTVAINQPLQLQAVDQNNSGFTEYRWSPPYGLDNPDMRDPTALLDRDITYSVTATTPEGCDGKGKISIKVYRGPDIYAPNAFSPDGNGHNDILKVIPVGIKEFRYFKVFNRWGQLIFSCGDPGRGWNGRINGMLQDSGIFVWMAEGVDFNGKDIQRKGTVVLIR